jgi:hypothetical protein
VPAALLVAPVVARQDRRECNRLRVAAPLGLKVAREWEWPELVLWVLVGPAD